jgi:hypothetical protein
MSIADLTTVATDYSIEVPFLKGGFNLGNTCVPYFSSTLPAGELRSMLRLPSRLPVDPDQPIKLEELFQRELDHDRVRNRIMPYLRDDRSLRFFNALTVALLPLDPANPRRLAAAYPNDAALAPPARSEWEGQAVGPIMVSHPPGNADIGELRWNSRLTMPVILDGQHRFRAIEMLLTESQGQLHTDLAAMKVSILFLVFDPRVGFKAAEEMSVLSSCRDIFVDLNKHAVTVPRARLALLDDRSPWSMSMRSILASGVGVDPTPPSTRVEETGRLPLTLVNWRGDTAKFDTGHHLTSLLTLQDMVEHVLGAPVFRPLDYDRARQVVDVLAARLDIEATLDFDLSEIQSEIDAAERDERPFELSRPQAKAVGAAFGERVGRRITRPLVRLSPYATLIEKLSEAGLIGTELEPWLSFNDVERAALLEQLGAEDPTGQIQRISEEVKREKFGLAFQVVFQKAFIYSANSMTAAGRELAPHWQIELADGCDAEALILDAWIERFNAFVTPALAADRTTSPFVGAGVRATGDIDFRKTRIRTITGFVSYVLLAPMSEWIEHKRAGTLSETAIKEWVIDCWAQIAPGPRGPLAGLFSLHGKNWRNGIDEVVQASAVADDEDLSDPEIRAAERINFAVLQLRRTVELAIDT